MPSTKLRRIVFAVYKGVALLDLAGPLEAFLAANAVSSTRSGPSYECVVASWRGGRVMTAHGVELHTMSLRTAEKKPIHTLIVPGSFDIEDVIRDPGLLQWLVKTAPSCKRVCSVCGGSFLLAEAGILNGRRAATHWVRASLLAARYPKVAVEPDAIFVRDGRVWTSAGGTSGIDLALALIEQDSGRRIAIEVARILVVYLKRAGGQSQYSALLTAQAQSDSDPFGELEIWIAEHLTADLRVEALADRVHMSPRNFARLYSKTRGRTPAKAVETIRVDAARRRLEETTDPITTIAEGCGFANDEQMRTTFNRALGVPPSEYRKRFSSIQPPN
jgi:transcriptional regulator GlxA family with amidase domain